MPESSMALTLPDRAESGQTARHAKQAAPRLANRVAGKQLPSPESGVEQIPLRAFSQPATIHLSKKCMNGKNPAAEPSTVLQVSQIFESWPNTPLWIVFTLLALQPLTPKSLITVLEVQLQFRHRLHWGSFREIHAHFSTQTVSLHMDHWPKDKSTHFPFPESWSTLLRARYSRTDLPNSLLPFPSLPSSFHRTFASPHCPSQRIGGKGTRGGWTQST